VQALSQTQIKAKGYKISSESEPLPEGYEGPHPDWDYNVGETQFFDNAYKLPCSFGETNAKKLCQNATNYKKEGLFDLRRVPKELLLKTPKMLPSAKTRDEALAMVSGILLDGKNERYIKTPIDEVLITGSVLSHFVEKEGEDRERYANFILPTLENPLEIWFTRFDDGKIRPQYIAVFDAPKAMLVSVIINRDGSLGFYNGFVSESLAKMNKNRVGDWFWKKY